jgi:hypothetical protein
LQFTKTSEDDRQFATLKYQDPQLKQMVQTREYWRANPDKAAKLDMFSVGIILEEVLTLNIKSPQPAVRDIKCEELSAWKTIIARMTHPDHARRYTSLADVSFDAISIDGSSKGTDSDPSSGLGDSSGGGSGSSEASSAMVTEADPSCSSSGGGGSGSSQASSAIGAEVNPPRSSSGGGGGGSSSGGASQASSAIEADVTPPP